MDDLLSRLEQLQKEAEADSVRLSDAALLEQFRIKYLGRKGAIPEILERLKELSPEQKREVGKRANQLKAKLEQAYQQASRRISSGQVKSAGDFFDYTLPGDRKSTRLNSSH